METQVQIEQEVRVAQLTQRQTAILEFIDYHRGLYGYPPTVREIGADVGLRSSSTVLRELEWLAERGYVQRAPRKSRTVSVTERGLWQIRPTRRESTA